MTFSMASPFSSLDPFSLQESASLEKQYQWQKHRSQTLNKPTQVQELMKQHHKKISSINSPYNHSHYMKTSLHMFKVYNIRISCTTFADRQIHMYFRWHWATMWPVCFWDAFRPNTITALRPNTITTALRRRIHSKDRPSANLNSK